MNPADTETALGLIRLCQQSECILNESGVNLDLNTEVGSGEAHINIKSEQVRMHNELKVTFQSRCIVATSQNDKCLVTGVNMHTAQLAHVS